MSNNRFNLFSSVNAFFIKNDLILLSERMNTGFMDGFFGPIGGHLDGGEQISTAMKREIQEEIGLLDVVLNQPIHIMHRIISPTEERIDFFFVVNSWTGEIANKEPDKCKQLSWENIKMLPENTVPYIRKAIREIEKGNFFSECDC